MQQDYCTISIDSARGVTCDTAVAFRHSDHLRCDLWQKDFSTIFDRFFPWKGTRTFDFFFEPFLTCNQSQCNMWHWPKLGPDHRHCDMWLAELIEMIQYIKDAKKEVLLIPQQIEDCTLPHVSYWTPPDSGGLVTRTFLVWQGPNWHFLSGGVHGIPSYFSAGQVRQSPTESPLDMSLEESTGIHWTQSTGIHWTPLDSVPWNPLESTGLGGLIAN